MVNMVKMLVLGIVLLMINSTAIGQEGNLSFMKKNYFKSLEIGGAHVFTTPENDKGDVGVGLSLVNVAYNSRINLVNIKDKSSIAVSVPVMAAYSMVEEDGVFSVHSPITVDFSFGNHSTYNNVNMLGLQVGAGVMVNYVSILNSGGDRWYAQFYTTPIVNVGFKIDRGKRNKVVRLYTTPNVLEAFGGKKANTYFGFSLGFLLKY